MSGGVPIAGVRPHARRGWDSTSRSFGAQRCRRRPPTNRRAVTGCTAGRASFYFVIGLEGEQYAHCEVSQKFGACSKTSGGPMGYSALRSADHCVKLPDGLLPSWSCKLRVVVRPLGVPMSGAKLSTAAIDSARAPVPVRVSSRSTRKTGELSAEVVVCVAKHAHPHQTMSRAATTLHPFCPSWRRQRPNQSEL